MKYRAVEFKVTLVWFTERGVGHRRFRKYRDAVAWAERNLKTKEVVVRILGTLTAEEEDGDVGGNDTLSVGNGGQRI